MNLEEEDASKEKKRRRRMEKAFLVDLDANMVGKAVIVVVEVVVVVDTVAVEVVHGNEQVVESGKVKEPQTNWHYCIHHHWDRMAE